MYIFSNQLSTDLQPIFEIPPQKYAGERVLKILLDPLISVEKICKVRPHGITSSATYVVDTNCLNCLDDIKKDEFGIWSYSGSHTVAYQVCDEGNDCFFVERCSSRSKSSNVYYLRRLHCVHPVNNDFKHMICFLSGKI